MGFAGAALAEGVKPRNGSRPLDSLRKAAWSLTFPASITFT
jgi:hypothetical protein